MKLKLSAPIGKIILISVAAALALAVAAGAYFVYFYPDVYAGALLNGQDMGGMSKDELRQHVSSMTAYEGAGPLVFLMGGETLEIPLNELDASLNVDETVELVYSYGRGGDFLTNLRQSLRLAPSENTFPAYSLDTNLAKDKLRQKADQLQTEYSDSYYRLEGGLLKISKGASGVAFDVDACAEIIDDQAANGHFEPIEVPMVQKDPDPLDIDQIVDELTVEPQNATYEKDENGGLKIIPHTVGITFDKDRLKTLLQNNSGEISLPAEPYIPEFTAEGLEQELFGDVLADVITYLNMYNRPRTKNIWLAAQETDGTVLMPGDEFSFNRIVGERTYEKGYRLASVYTRTGNDEGLAGGICQLSSTIHMAAIRANLELVQRANHVYTVPYCSPGEDATVYWGSIDFRFLNSRDYPIKIETIQEKDYVICRIYGKKLEDEPEVKIESKILSSSGYSTKRVEDPTLAPGKTKIDQEGHSGASSETYRVLYKDGQEVSRTLLNTSRYIPLTQIILFGPDPSAPPAVEAPTPETPVPELPPDPEPSIPSESEPDPYTPPDPFEQLEDLFGLE